MTEQGHDQNDERPAAGRTIALLLLVMSSVVTIATWREASIGRDETVAADVAAARSDWPAAIAHARAAAEAFVPGSASPDRALRHLAAIGHDAEARGDDTTALLAYGAIRGAVMATGIPGGKSARWRLEAEQGLGRVAVTYSDPSGTRPAAGSMLTALHRDDPTDWSLAVLALSAVATLAGLSRLAWLGPAAPGGRLAGAIAAAGFVAYAAVLLAH